MPVPAQASYLKKKEELLNLLGEILMTWENYQEIPRQIQILTFIARVYENHAMLSKAEEIYLSAERILNNSPSASSPDLVVAVQNNLALIEQRLGKHQEAVNAFKKALEVSPLLENKVLEPQINNNLGALYSDLGNFTFGRNTSEKSRKVFTENL